MVTTNQLPDLVIWPVFNVHVIVQFEAEEQGWNVKVLPAEVGDRGLCNQFHAIKLQRMVKGRGDTVRAAVGPSL